MTKKADGEKAVRIGRPSEFNQEIADAVCEWISKAKSLRSFCEQPGMPHRTTILKWLQDFPSFATQYARGREEQANYIFEEILEIADEDCTMVRADKHGSRDDDGQGNTEVIFDSVAVQRNKLRIDARKWMAGKLRPKVYGEKYLAIEPKQAEEKFDDLASYSQAELDAAIAKAQSAVQQERTEK